MSVRIVRQLEVKGLSQAAFAEIVGVSRTTVNQWCLGTSEPTPENLLNIAHVLFDDDVGYLVYGADRAPEGGFPSLPRGSPRISQSADDSFAGRIAPLPMRRRRKT